jgi:3-oxoacyl-[acyl-carrier protein] reductase
MSRGALAGRAVVVTGGTRGIGRALVLGAVEQGARVAFCARRAGEAARALVDEVERRGGRAIGVTADVSSEADVEMLFESARGAFGRVDAVVSSAAVSHDALLVSMGTEQWNETLAVNLTGAFLVARVASRDFLRRGGGGRIVMIGSLAQEGAPSNACYAASKGGLVGLSRWIATELGPARIAVNLVVAGYVETSLTARLPAAMREALIASCPHRRAATAEEVACVALFLASPRAEGLTGQIVHASGGLFAVP